jgi:hypothetical protein
MKKLLLATAMSFAVVSSGYAQTMPTCDNAHVIELVEQIIRNASKHYYEKLDDTEIMKIFRSQGLIALFNGDLFKTIPGLTPPQPGHGPDPKEVSKT